MPRQDRRDGSVPIVSSSGISGYHDTAKVSGPGVVTGRYGTLGEVFYIDRDYWPLNTTLYVRDFKGSDPRFITYFLQTLDLAHQNAAGAVPGLNRNALHLLSVSIPPLSTQRKIAAILSAYDDLIANNARRIALLEALARALYREWFIHFRFPGHERVPLVASALGPIPQGWEVRKFSEAVCINPTTRVSKEGEKPFVPMNSLSNNSMLIGEVETRTGNSGSKFKNGDTLFARITPCLENGKTGFVQLLPSEDAVTFGSTEFIVMRSKTVCPEYVYLTARTDEFRDNAIKSMSGATGRQRVQEACFDRFLMAQPDPATLTAFAKQAQPLFKAIHIFATKSANLRHTRDLLLPKLVSGEIDANDLPIQLGNSDG